jgi:hypothetical protein
MNDLIITAMSKCHEYDGPDFVPERESLAATVSRMKEDRRMSVYRAFFESVYSQSRNTDIAAATQLSVHEVTAMARKFSLFKDSRTLTRFTVEELKVILMHTCTKSGY